MTEQPRGQEPPDVQKPEVLHETTDVNVWGIVLFGASLVVGAIIIHLLIWGLYVYFGGINAPAGLRQYPMAPVDARRLPPEPRLQTRPREDLKALRAEEEKILNSYGWVNAAGGVVRLPIDEAMKRVLQQGLPVLPREEGAAPIEGRPTASSSGRFVEPVNR